MSTKPRLLAIVPEFSPSAIVNVVTPLEAMAERGLIDLVIRLERETNPSDLIGADALILCRNWEPLYRPIYELALQMGIPLIYDLDDHVLIAPAGSHTQQVFQAPGRRAMFEWLLSQAAIVRVHSPHLAQAMQGYTTKTAIVWAAIDWTLVPPDLPPLLAEPVHIVYAAQRETAAALYPQMRADLHRVLAAYGERVRLHFLGYAPPDLKKHPLVIIHPFDSDYRAFFNRFTRAGYAIGLAPMLDEPFYNCKTNIKFRDYAAAGAAGVYADTPLYRANGVIDGETGLLVTGEPGSWFDAIERLILQPDLIQSIRVNAYAYARAKYHIDTVSQMWLSQVATLRKPLALSTDELARVLQQQWHFTYEKKPDVPIVAWLRKVLRNTLPANWRLTYYDLSGYIRIKIRKMVRMFVK